MTKVKIQHPNLSIAAKCRLLSISRASVYYQPRPIPSEDLVVLRAIDQYFLECAVKQNN